MRALGLNRNLTDAELRRYTRRLAVLLVVGLIAFAAFYVIDRWRPAAPAIVDQQVAALEQAVRDNPNDIGTRGQLADTYVAKGRFQDALTQYDLIIATGTSLEPAHLGRARALVGLARLDEAIPEFQAVVDIAKGGEMAHVDALLAAAYYGLGDIALQQGRSADAVPNLEAALKISPSDADTLYLLGRAYAGNGDPDGAVVALRRAVEFVPFGWSAPYAALAEVYTSNGKAAAAAWATAMAQLMDGKAAAAEAGLLALVDGDAGVDAAIGLGLLEETGGDNAAAAEWYAKALALDPASSAAKLGLSRVGPAPTTSGEGSGS